MTLIAKGSMQNLTWSSATDSISKGFYLDHDAVKYNKDSKLQHIRSAKQDDNYGASNIVLPCSGS
jgi:hypothetical protein